MNDETPTPSFERSQWQFSLRALLVTITGVAIVFALLRLLGVDPVQVAVGLVASVFGSGAAVGLVTIYWLMIGGPKNRQATAKPLEVEHRSDVIIAQEVERSEMIERLAQRRKQPPSEP